MLRRSEHVRAGRWRRGQECNDILRFQTFSDLNHSRWGFLDEFDIQTRVYLQSMCLHLNSNLNKSLHVKLSHIKHALIHSVQLHNCSLFTSLFPVWCNPAYVRIHPDALCFTSRQTELHVKCIRILSERSGLTGFYLAHKPAQTATRARVKARFLPSSQLFQEWCHTLN